MLQWMPGRSEILYNEKADNFAKRFAQWICTNYRSNIPHNYMKKNGWT